MKIERLVRKDSLTGGFKYHSFVCIAEKHKIPILSGDTLFNHLFINYDIMVYGVRVKLLVFQQIVGLFQIL